MRLGTAPDTWSYANTNYLLTAMIIERITGRSCFGELLGYHAWAGVTADGSRTAVVYVAGDGTEATMGAMSALIKGGVGGTL